MHDKLMCACGNEAILHVDMSTGPGCMCHVECVCGRRSKDVWDVRLPWADIVEGWSSVQRNDRPVIDYLAITRDISSH
jgi:hypothetical protein